MDGSGVLGNQVANALAVARSGRSASAERMLREALGVLDVAASMPVPLARQRP